MPDQISASPERPRPPAAPRSMASPTVRQTPVVADPNVLDPNTRPTIGLIIATGDDTLYRSALDVADARGANLIAFVGGRLRDTRPFKTHANVVYDLVDREHVDGLIVKTSSLSNYVGREEVQRFCEKYRPLPIVSVGMELEGIPSVTVDDYQGIRNAVQHLSVVHGLRHLAFIRGVEEHPSAEARHRAFREAMLECGLDLDPKLISPPSDWSARSGERAVHLLLDEHQARFDAILGSSDDHAFGAVRALQARGLRVPEDVAVVGIGDYQISQASSPPLTTIRLRRYQRGRRAAEMLLDMLEGRSVPDRVRLPTTMVVRRSCGCLEPTLVQAAAVPTQMKSAVVSLRDVLLGTGREQVLREMAEQVSVPQAARAWAGQLMDAFYAELVANREPDATGAFLTLLGRALSEISAAGSEVGYWQGMISVLRSYVLASLRDDSRLLARAERLWEQARVMIGERAQQAYARQIWQAEQWMDGLLKINQALTAVNSLPELTDVLARELPAMGIPGCWLSFYEDADTLTGRSRLLLAYDGSGRIEPNAEARLFPSPKLMPDGLLPTGRRYRLVVESLHFQHERLGFVVFEAGPGSGLVYDVLGQQISTALKSASLVVERTQLYHKALQAQAEAEEANRLKSRFLSTVSHELLTPLSLVTGLSAMLLQKTSADALPLPKPYRHDLARIHASARHLHGLIRDVLDLGRSQVGQLKLVRKPLRLSEVVNAVSLIGEQMARERGLIWQVKAPEQLPWISGDRTRLQQVVLNLVSNAIKFTEQGTVGLRIEAGAEQVVVQVYDTGLGVPKEEREAIFDEFRQSERTAARGYGGLGIGLALCRQLVELHGGTMGVCSSGEEGAGSTFFFTLPTIQIEAIAESGEGIRSQALLLTRPTSAGTHLLEHLTQAGLAVRVIDVEKTQDWVSRVLASPPGAVVLDFEPAGEQGWKLMEALRDHPATEDIPVLFYSLPEGQDRGAVWALDYLAKPLDNSALVRALERLGLVSADESTKRTILVVDDEPQILEMHARLIETQSPGTQVLRAANGREALAMMEREQPDLVLLDLMMPELDGFGVLKAMREREPTREVPVIVLTARALTEEDMARLNRGVETVLKKGMFSAEETLAHITEALTRSKHLRGETRWLVRKAMAYVHEHFAEPLSCQDIARHVSVSASHLTRCFRMETGLTPVAYLNRYRLQQAKELLKVTDGNITEIAMKVGFSDGSYFARSFRREEGMSPSDYRRGEPRPS